MASTGGNRSTSVRLSSTASSTTHAGGSRGQASPGAVVVVRTGREFGLAPRDAAFPDSRDQGVGRRRWRGLTSSPLLYADRRAPRAGPRIVRTARSVDNERCRRRGVLITAKASGVVEVSGLHTAHGGLVPRIARLTVHGRPPSFLIGQPAHREGSATARPAVGSDVAAPPTVPATDPAGLCGHSTGGPSSSGTARRPPGAGRGGPGQPGRAGRHRNVRK